MTPNLSCQKPFASTRAQAPLRSYPFSTSTKQMTLTFSRIFSQIDIRTKMNGHSFYACPFLICYLPDVKKNRQNKAEQQNL